jgi:hypothetical protein
MFFRARFDPLFLALLFVGLLLTELAPNLGFSAERLAWIGTYQDLGQMLQAKEHRHVFSGRGRSEPAHHHG